MRIKSLLLFTITAYLLFSCSEDENLTSISGSETIEPIATSSLPENSQSYLDFTYPIASVDEAYLVISDNTINYEAVLDNRIRPVFGEEGNFRFNRENFGGPGIGPGKRPKAGPRGPHNLPGDSIDFDALPEHTISYLSQNYNDAIFIMARQIERPNGDIYFTVILKDVGVAIFDTAGDFIEIKERPMPQEGRLKPEIEEIDIAEIPEAIISFVATEYPEAVIERAGIHVDEDGATIYALKLDGKNGVLIFDTDGNFVEAKKPRKGQLPHAPGESIAIADLPETIQAYVRTNYPDDAIEDARMVETPTGEIHYIIKLVMGGIIKFDEAGQLLG